MRKIFIVAAVIFVLLSTQSGYMANVDSAQTSVITPSDSTCDWPMFGRTPDGNRVVPDECCPNSRDLKVKWEFKAENIIHAPVISEDKVFAGSYDKKAYCIDVNTGSKLWDFTTKDWIISSPAIFSKYVYVTSFDGKIYCLSSDNGSKKWEFDTGFQIHGSPIIYNDNLYVASGSKIVYCFDPITGKRNWEFNTDSILFNTLAISQNRVYVGDSLHNFYCLSANSGELIWKFDPMLDSYIHIFSAPVIFERNILISTNEGVICIDVDGNKKWQFNAKSTVEQTPTVYKNRVYFSVAGDENKLFCLDLNNGKLIFEYEYKLATNIVDTPSPTISNSNVILVSDKGLIFIDAITGECKVKFPIDIGYHATTVSLSSMKLLLNVDSSLICIYSDSPDEKKRIPTSITQLKSNKIIDKCQSTQLSAKVLDQNGQEIENAPIQWSVDPPGFGTIDSSGLFTPKKTGKVKITCKSGNLSESTTIDVIEFLTVNSEGVRIDVVKPKQVASKTIAYTNNSDRKLTVDVVSTLGLVTVSPSSFVIEPGKSQEVSVSAQLASFEPVPDTEFVITASYDTCAKQLKGLLSSSLPFACLSASPDTLAFGMVERGYAKTMSLSILSEVETKISVSTSEAWISVPVKEMTLKAGVPAIISFKIHASSLPSASRLSGNVIIKSDVAFCDTLTIPVTVETEESITIKLKIDSKSATINNQKRDLDAPPKIMGGRTMVPLRFISEAFGCNIEWDAKEQRIGILRYDISVNLWIGKDYVEVNGQKLKIDSPPVIVGGRTMVPLRFIAEPFGAKVEWNAQSKEITIVWPKP